MSPGSSTSPWPERQQDRKSTRLNSSHMSISYAVFCLKKKKQLPTGVLGNAFDVTQVDINTVRMSRGSPSGTFGAEVTPTHITFAYVATPFDGKDYKFA